MTEKEIGKILKKIKIEMTKKGINQSQLATKLGLTPSANVSDGIVVKSVVKIKIS